MSIKPYSSDGSKAEQIREMFDKIAPRYDLLNHLLSLGIDRGWRKRLVSSASRSNPQSILDVATGTGDLALMLRRQTSATITGVDISTGMLEVGRAKAAGLDRITFASADAENLPMPDASFDTVTAAFGVRNFENLERGMTEMCRVLKPEGELYVLEFAMPEKKLLGKLYRFYFRSVLPKVGRMISGDSRAYTYLPESVGEFPYGTRFAELLTRCGFRNVEMQELMGGIAIIYKAIK